MNSTTQTNGFQTVSEDKNKLINHIKNEIKIGKRIPVGIKYDQEIVDSYNKELKSFDKELIERKGGVVKDYKSWIYLSSKKRKLILRTETPLSKYLKNVLNDLEEDKTDEECFGDELLNSFFSTVLDLVSEIADGKKKTLISTETAQRLIEDIAGFTITTNEYSEEIDTWLNN